MNIQQIRCIMIIDWCIPRYPMNIHEVFYTLGIFWTDFNLLHQSWSRIDPSYLKSCTTSSVISPCSHPTSRPGPMISGWWSHPAWDSLELTTQFQAEWYWKTYVAHIQILSVNTQSRHGKKKKHKVCETQCYSLDKVYRKVWLLMWQKQ